MDSSYAAARRRWNDGAEGQWEFRLGAAHMHECGLGPEDSEGLGNVGGPLELVAEPTHRARSRRKNSMLMASCFWS